MTSAAGASMLGDHELGGEGSRAAEPALLPAADERPRRPRVGDGGARRSEGEPAPGALAAAADGHAVGAPQQRAARGTERPQLEQAGGAERVGRDAARDAAAGKEKIEKPRRAR